MYRRPITVNTQVAPNAADLPVGQLQVGPCVDLRQSTRQSVHAHSIETPLLGFIKILFSLPGQKNRHIHLTLIPPFAALAYRTGRLIDGFRSPWKRSPRSPDSGRAFWNQQPANKGKKQTNVERRNGRLIAGRFPACPSVSVNW